MALIDGVTDYKVTESFTGLGPDGPEKKRLISFKYREHGPFTIELRPAEFVPARISEEIAKITSVIDVIG